MAGADGRLPDFLIVGAMRAGTTSLTRYLDTHPDVFMSRPKEIHYFDRHHARGEAWYRRHFADAAPGQRTGEATPMYSHSEAAMDRMAALCPDATLLMLLRDPVRRAHSHWCHNVQRGRDDRSFARAVEEGPDPRDAAEGHRWAYVDRSRYARQIDLLLERFPRSQLHLERFEDLIADPAATFRRVCEAIGVDPGHVPPNLGERTNPPLRIRSVRVRDASRRLPKAVQNAVGRLNSTTVENPPLDPADAARVAALLADDVARLARDHGVDVSGWTTAGTG